VEVLERKGIAIVKGEIQNIKEVEHEEQLDIIDPSDFLFDISSEQVEVPADFDWSGLIDVGGIAAEGPCSPEGS